MANYREFNVQLASMSGMRRVTSTMKMVAASHLHRAHNEMSFPVPFAKELRKLTAIAIQLPGLRHHRLFSEPLAGPAKILLMVMCSDRGLCGSFNSTIVHEVRHWVAEQRLNREVKVDTIYVGQKGYNALRRELPSCMKTFNLSAHPKYQETAPISSYAMDKFMDGTYTEVWITGSLFVNTLKHDAVTKRILPFVDHFESALPVREGGLPIVEPMDDRILTTIMRQWVHYYVNVAQLHRAASEQASRVMSMESATTNLGVMEKDLLLQRNRARQAAITNELNEIVSGAETLA
ncbi:MAG: FoF1 ATP synthase subunit gamma [bacterium]